MERWIGEMRRQAREDPRRASWWGDGRRNGGEEGDDVRDGEREQSREGPEREIGMAGEGSGMEEDDMEGEAYEMELEWEMHGGAQEEWEEYGREEGRDGARGDGSGIGACDGTGTDTGKGTGTGTGTGIDGIGTGTVTGAGLGTDGGIGTGTAESTGTSVGAGIDRVPCLYSRYRQGMEGVRSEGRALHTVHTSEIGGQRAVVTVMAGNEEEEGEDRRRRMRRERR